MTTELRTYQARIIASIGGANAIVKMPTGSGKTVVAAEMIKIKLDEDSSLAALFLVPTLDLVDQQSKVLKKWCPHAHVFPFRGGMADPPKEETEGQVCIVATPDAFLALRQRKNHVFGWHAFSIVVFDEVHHVLKDHPYRHIALRLKAWHDREMGSEDERIQILGLSASLTYDVTEAKVTSTLNRLCAELSIENMASPSVEELEEGGYLPPCGRNVELDFSSEIPEGVVAKSERKNHMI